MPHDSESMREAVSPHLEDFRNRLVAKPPEDGRPAACSARHEVERFATCGWLPSRDGRFLGRFLVTVTPQKSGGAPCTTARANMSAISFRTRRMDNPPDVWTRACPGTPPAAPLTVVLNARMPSRRETSASRGLIYVPLVDRYVVPDDPAVARSSRRDFLAAR